MPATAMPATRSPVRRTGYEAASERATASSPDAWTMKRSRAAIGRRIDTGGWPGGVKVITALSCALSTRTVSARASYWVNGFVSGVITEKFRP